MPADPAGAVLDTNTVLDWLVFRDAAAAPLGRAIEAGRLRWIATPAMRAEFDQVLSRPALAGWASDPQELDAAWARHANLLPADPPTAALRCRDPADQVFIDLALGAGSRWLFTRDRALLELARSARGAGVHILRPSDWTEDDAWCAATGPVGSA